MLGPNIDQSAILFVGGVPICLGHGLNHAGREGASHDRSGFIQSSERARPDSLDEHVSDGGRFRRPSYNRAAGCVRYKLIEYLILRSAADDVDNREAAVQQ